MITLEALEKRINTAGSLLSVVTSMKNLAAVNMRQYERAVEALGDFAAVNDYGWYVLLRGGGIRPVRPKGRPVCLVIGSDQGLCGVFNEVAAQKGLEVIDGLSDAAVWCSGARVAAALSDAGRPPEVHIPQPAGLTGLGNAAMHVVRELADLPGELVVVSNAPEGAGSFVTSESKVLPLDAAWLDARREAAEPRRNLPMSGLPSRELLSYLFRQYLFISLYKAFGYSMAAENAARLASMQRAEKNVEEMGEDLRARHRELRQNLITSELLEVVAGFEALTGGDGV